MPQKRAAIGVQMHSGWGVLVAVAFCEKKVEVADRRRIVVVDPAMPGGNQLYHHARLLLDQQSLAEAERYLDEYAATCEQIATFAMEEAVMETHSRGYRIVGAAILRGAGRTLPALPQILAAHPLIHTAEGEFFGRTVRKACERLNMPVTSIRRRDLEEQMKVTFGKAAAGLQRSTAALGKQTGPPWTADHKAAALAALTILARKAAIPS